VREVAGRCGERADRLSCSDAQWQKAVGGTCACIGDGQKPRARRNLRRGQLWEGGRKPPEGWGPLSDASGYGTQRGHEADGGTEAGAARCAAPGLAVVIGERISRRGSDAISSTHGSPSVSSRGTGADYVLFFFFFPWEYDETKSRRAARICEARSSPRSSGERCRGINRTIRRDRETRRNREGTGHDDPVLGRCLPCCRGSWGAGPARLSRLAANGATVRKAKGGASWFSGLGRALEADQCWNARFGSARSAGSPQLWSPRT